MAASNESGRPAPARLRADRLLVERGLFESRARAQAAIEAGKVFAAGRLVTRASEPLAGNVELTAEPAHPWVSRGGLKLVHALDRFGFDPAGRLCLDIGASTGGFTEVLLDRGAAAVIAADVGHGQLHPSLANDPRVTLLEGRDARSLAAADLPRPAEAIVIDVSFISLALVLPAVLPLAAPDAFLVALVKPQFEAGRAALSKGGIVRDEAVQAGICARVAADVAGRGWSVEGVIPSPILGGDGNAEFLLGARHG